MDAKTIRAIAINMALYKPSYSQIEDDVSLCEYVSRIFKVELTLAEAKKLRAMFDNPETI